MSTEEVSQAEFGERTGMSRQRVSRYVRDGILPKSASGKIPWLAGLQALIEHLSETAAGRGGAGGVASLTEARTRLAEAQRESIDLKNRALKDEYVLVADAARRMDSICISVRTRLLSVQNELPAAAPHFSRRDIETVDSLIRAALTELADGFEAEDAS